MKVACHRRAGIAFILIITLKSYRVDACSATTCTIRGLRPVLCRSLVNPGAIRATRVVSFD